MTSTSTPSAEGLNGRDLPHLVFRDLTGRSALQFDALDAELQLFHVVVLKERYRLGPPDAAGLSPMIADDAPPSLNDDDLPHDGDPRATIREESDLSPYKPHADVLVVGSAHAPGTRPVPSFIARLRLFSPKAKVPAAQDDVVSMRDSFDVLIDKPLLMHGQRWWVRTETPPNAARSGDKPKAASSGPADWRLTPAEPMQRCPLRYELAFGGQCRIDVGSPLADSVAVKHRLRDDQLAAHPDAALERPLQPLAHEASWFNPAGTGFTRAWYLSATAPERLPAHRIDLAQQPVTVDDFWHVAVGRESVEPAGFGPVERGWRPRVAWIGTRPPGPERIAAGLALNLDFDFRYWNCAPADQQCAPLHGGERLVLDNLWPPEHPASQTDAQGQRRVMFELPGRALMLMGVDGQGELHCHDPVIDTVLVDSDDAHVDICWRWRVDASQGLVEARLIEAATEGQATRLAHLRAVLARPLPPQTPEPDADAA